MSEHKLQPSDVVNKYFRFSREDDTFSRDPIIILENGVICGYSHKNESSWRMEDGCLVFLTDDGRVSTRFDCCRIEDGKIMLSGSFVLNKSKGIVHRLEEINFEWETRSRHEPCTRSLFAKNIKKDGWEVGDHTYGRPTIFEARWAKLKIGKFCSLATGTAISLGNHRLDSVTTYPFLALKKHWPMGFNVKEADHYTNGDVIIGNDVWIGFDAFILSGVHIGDGAVVAAKSVVTKDVPPYAIVAGSPAKIIRYRFSEHQIKQLLAVRWWDWEDERINAMLPLMYRSIDEFLEFVFANGMAGPALDAGGNTLPAPRQP